MGEKIIKGDFEIFKVDKAWNNIKWLDTLTSCVVSHWDDDMPAIHVLYDYSSIDNFSIYSREISYGADFISYFKRNGMEIQKEGIDIVYKNTTMDNIKVDIDSVLDRYRKQVMDIVNLDIDKS